MNQTSIRLTFLLILSFILSCSNKEAIYQFDPRPNSSIVFIGNTFAVALQQHNYFETLLYKSFPDRNLTVRNLAWPADEINLQPRPVNFGTYDEHLHEQKADVIFACFGLNESFKGPDSLGIFKTRLHKMLASMQSQKYNGTSPPVIILVSPIAHEKLGGSLPDPKVHNEHLQSYVRSMGDVAAQLHIPFIDLYAPTAGLMIKDDSLTVNGIHLNDKGYRLVSEIMAEALDFPVSSWSDEDSFVNLKNCIAIKNKHFFYKFKAANGEYIYGRRREWAAGQALDEESKKIDQMVQQLDSVIWKGSKESGSLAFREISKIVVDNRASPESKAADTSQSPDKEVSQFILQDGYQIELFASELEFPIANPVSFTFDPQGRMWVATMPSYPHYHPGSPPNDQIIILEDTDHDGRADRHTVFADSLYLPVGFEVGDGGVYVTQAPELIFLKDTDGDGMADYRRTVLSGFGNEDAHHAISDYSWGPDGALYMNEGTFLHSQIETAYGPVRGANGITWRFEPRAMKLDPYISFPYANPWGQVFMRNGTHLIADVSTGMNYFAPPMTVAIDYPIKHKQMKDFLTIERRPKTCGMEIVSSRQFPENAQGNVLFNTFIGFQGIKQHRITEERGGIVAHETEPLLQSTDRNFRPVDLKFGPDGALYLADWYDPVIQHGEQNFRDPNRDHTRGRIWRITYKGKAVLKPVDLTQLSVDALLDQLKVYEDRLRYRARVRLRDLPKDEVIPALKKWISNLDGSHPDHEYHLLEGLWVCQQVDHIEAPLLERLLQSKDRNIRAAATRVLFYWNDRIDNGYEKLMVMSRDPEPRVRVEAIAALSHFKTEGSVRALLEITQQPTEYYVDYALDEAFKHLKPVWMEMFKKDQHFLADEPEKARRLLQPLASQEALNAEEYFVKDDPLWHSFSYQALSAADFEELAGATAVSNFQIHYKPAGESHPASGNEKSVSKKMNGVVIQLAALSGKMQFDKTTLTVPAGKDISLVFLNLDQMAHNVVVVLPASVEKVGTAADAMASLKDGYERNFVPDLPEVVFATPLVNGGQTFQLNFKAPSKRGEYPFICSFPGHWRMMKGILKVL